MLSELKGIKYTGEWQHDLRHGEGVLEYKSGKKITGTWLYDRLDGEAEMTTINKSGKHRTSKVTFFNDVMIPTENQFHYR